MDCLIELKYEFYKRKLVLEGQRKAKNAEILPMTEPIDFVVTWVDGSDPEWSAENEKYKQQCGIKTEKDAHGECRIRDWDIFQYWFRAVEKYAPWVNRVYLVTCGQIPDWLDVNSPKLKLVHHKDFIPAQYLPVFSSIPIELNLYRIPGLCEHFVYFNDDMFLNKVVQPEDFFRGGLPNYSAVARPIAKYGANDTFSHMQFSTIATANSIYGTDISRSIGSYPEKWFLKDYGEYYIADNLYAYDQNYLPGMLFPHLGVAFRKSMTEKVWKTIHEQLHRSCLNKFRTPNDITHQIFSVCAMLEGEFNPVSKEHHGKVFSGVLSERDNIVNAIVNESYRMICINDSEQVTDEDYSAIKQAIKDAFEKVFPDKSSFEK